MRIGRVKINSKSYYFIDGDRIRSDALHVMIKGVYGEEICKAVYHEVINKGFAVVEKYSGCANQPLIEQLDIANKKITALEKKVAELTVKNLYLQTA